MPRTLVGRNPVSITGQPGLAAIALPRLDVLEQHTRTMRLPASRLGPELRIRVPWLGAFTLNKAATFADRQPDAESGSSPKRGKDLVYLGDLMSAGPGVLDGICADLSAMKRDADAVMLARLARSRLGALLRSPGHADWLAASEILGEKGIDPVGARAELEGRLTDLYELLATMTSRKLRKRKE